MSAASGDVICVHEYGLPSSPELPTNLDLAELAATLLAFPGKEFPQRRRGFVPTIVHSTPPVPGDLGEG